MALFAVGSGQATATNLRGAITYAAGTTGAVGSTTLFTVTGDVFLISLTAKCTTDLTSAGAPTWDLGVVGATAIIVSTMPDVTGWDTGEWADFDGTSYTIGHGTNQVGLINSGGFPISANIVQTIGTATITGGVVRWYVSYIPLSADGNIALHANLAAF